MPIYDINHDDRYNSLKDETMKINLPSLINDEIPNKNSNYWKEKYGDCHQKRKLAYDLSKKIYIRTRLAESQNWKCCWCGLRTTHIAGKKNSATIEHIIPVSKGGSNSIENLAMACSSCNNNRKDTEIKNIRYINNKAIFRSKDGMKSSKAIHREKLERKYKKRAEHFAKNNWKEISFSDWMESIKKSTTIEFRKLLISEYGVM